MNVGDFLLGVAGLQAGLIRPDDFATAVREWESSANEAPFSSLLALSCQDNAMEILRAHAANLAGRTEQDLPAATAELRAIMKSLGLDTSNAITLHPISGEDFGLADGGLDVGEEISGRYQHSVEHAQGGMGKVYIVYDTFLARRIALKELLPIAPVSNAASTMDAKGLGPEPLARQRRSRFLYEARITGQLEHPSIVPVYELGRRADGTPYYTMRLIRGKSLRQAIRLAGDLSGRLRLLSHFTDLCQAIAFAHSRGVIHRDIKPGNVMVGDFGETVVIDWGLAKSRQFSAGSADDSNLQQEIDLMKEAEAELVAVGTPAYMPPEQARGEMGLIDERSDVYSLGAVLYELLTGTAPYPDSTPAMALSKLLTVPPEPVEELVGGIPEELSAICSHAMARMPEDRYQSARELAADIEHFLAGRLVGVYRYKPMELFTHFIRRFKAPLIVGAVGLVGLLFTGSVAYVQVQAERNKAIVESHRALEAERIAENARQNAEQEFYLAAIASSRKFIEDFQYERALLQLERCAARYRQWEWGYLVYLCNRDQRTFQAHDPETVWSLAFAPNGKIAYSAGFDNTAKAWNLESGELASTYASPHGAVLEVSVHPTLPLLACAEENGYITLVNTDTGEIVKSWQANLDGDINCIQFAPDGTTFVTGDDKGYIRFWNSASGEQIRSIEPVNRGIEAIAYSSDGKHIASANRSEIVTVWEVESGAVQFELKGHTSRVTSLAYSPDGATLATGGRDSLVILWSMVDGTEQHRLAGHTSAVWSLAYSPDGHTVASGSSNLEIKLWDTDSGTAYRSYWGHKRQIYCLAYSPDGGTLLSGDEDGVMKEWAVRSPDTTSDYWTLTGHTGVVNHVIYSPDGKLLATSAGDWQTNDDTTTRLWDAETGKSIAVLAGHTASVRHAAFYHDGTVIATSSHDGTVRIWDVARHETLRVLGPFEAGVNVTTFSPNFPDQLAIGLRDGQVILANWRTGAIDVAWKEHEGEVLALTYSPHGQWFVSTSGDATVHVMRSDTRECVKVLRHTEARIPAAVFSPDGSFLATGGHDWRVMIWNTKTWETVHVLEGHTQGIYALNFSEDGRRLTSSGSDGSTIVWDMNTFREVLQLEGWVAAIRPGNLDIATGTTSGNVQLWPAFSWAPTNYPGDSTTPLEERVEAYKRNFWGSRLRSGLVVDAARGSGD